MKSCLFGTVKLIRNANKIKFAYNGRGIKHDGKGWSFGNDTARNVIISTFYNISSHHIKNPKNDFLVSGAGPAEGIDSSVASAEKKPY